MSLSRMAIFLVLLVLIAGGGHYYLWTRLVRDPAWPARWHTMGTWALVAMLVVMVGGFLARRAPRNVALPISWLAYSWMGVFFLLFMMLLVGDVATLLVRAVSAARGAPLEPERRLFLSRAIAAVVGGAAVIMGVSGALSVMAKTAIKRVPIRLPKLAKADSGFTLVQLTDVHVGPTIGKDFIEEIVRQVNELEADAVVITGDLVDGSVADLREHVAPLGKLRAKHGVFFVTGNHEYYSGVDEWLAHLGTLGVRVLRNEQVDLGAIHLAGVDDSSAHQFGRGHGEDIPKAVEGRDPNKPLVLLAHQPRAIEGAAESGVDLQLSGHTHGGQIIPWNFFVRLQQPYVAGLFEHRSALLYVSCGTGYWGPPMRVGAPAEITRIELLSS